jgi:hypothetical protein
MCQRVDAGWSLAAAAEAAGVSERRAREWRRRWEAGDLELEDRSSVAHAIPGKTPAEVEEAVCVLRELRFSGTRIADALGMSERTVRAVLARNGLSRLPRLDAHEPANRYERPAPGELVHIDVKKLGKIGRPGHRVNGDRTTRSRGSAGSSCTSASTTARAWLTSKSWPPSAPRTSSRSWSGRSRSSTSTASRCSG